MLPSRVAGVRGPRSQHFTTFIGCLRDLKYSVDSAIVRDIPLQGQDGVLPGCVDRCQAAGTCHHNGRCVNLYTDFHCDCFGTGHEGRTCEEKGKTPDCFVLKMEKHRFDRDEGDTGKVSFSSHSFQAHFTSTLKLGID